MKTKFLLVSFLAITLFISCSKTENPIDNSKSAAPMAYMVDMNDDGISDFKLEWNTTLTNDVPTEMVGYIFPLGSTQMLEDTTISTTSFLQLNDSIDASPSTPEFFTSATKPIIRKQKDETSWTVNSVSTLLTGTPMNPVYIGVKFQKDNMSYVGWAKIKFDTKSGEPQLLAKKYALDKCKIDQ